MGSVAFPHATIWVEYGPVSGDVHVNGHAHLTGAAGPRAVVRFNIDPSNFPAGNVGPSPAVWFLDQIGLHPMTAAMRQAPSRVIDLGLSKAFTATDAFNCPHQAKGFGVSFVF